MATLVLSTVGNVLGGPVGGAIGALIGQSIDQQLFGPGPRQGPRLNDLAVQTSSYGTAIPRIYGSMRVAGSVIWATDLKESSTLQSGGKNQPDVETYSYSVSMAVALSSRTASGIGRIWADGKLLRGAAGDFKVRTKFRFHNGDEDQPVDPLIASAEGIAETPAYRGLALAVFEDLELAEYGNRIPFLSMEILADGVPPTIGMIMSDVTGGLIQSEASVAIDGYAAHGTSLRAAVEPLVEHFPVDLGQSATGIETRTPILFQVDDDELGCAADGKDEARFERSVLAERSIPASLTIDYYGPARDYQAGRMRASAGSRSGKAEAVDLPMVLDADVARSVAENSLARRWAQRDRLTLRLPPQLIGLRAGDLVELPGSTRRWTVREVRIEAMIPIVELQAAWMTAPAILADPGRPAPGRDVVAGPSRLALLDLPDLGGGPALQLQLAVASSSEAWRQVPVEVGVGGTFSSSASAQVETVMGTTLTVLAAGEPGLFDTVASVEVELANDNQWLEGRDDEALIAGANLAAIGRELLQFGEAAAIGPRQFRLSRLLRGRFGSEWAIPGHSAGEPFTLLDQRTLRAISLPDTAIGGDVSVTAYGVGDGSGTSISGTATGEALRPAGPVHVRASQSGGSLNLSWIRRSRAGYAWADEIDAPVGEAQERYRVRLRRVAKNRMLLPVRLSQPRPGRRCLEAGPGPATVSVAQIGDRALSRWATLAITLP